METIKTIYTKAKQSLNYINKDQPSKGLSILKEAHKDLKVLRLKNPDLQLQINKVEVIVLNNLACAHNKKGKYKACLYNLQLAQALEEQIFKEENQQGQQQKATTHSNLCAVYSQMGHHDKALQEIRKAICYLEKSDKNIDSLIVCYYNCAIQLQFLSENKEAHKIAMKGSHLAKGEHRMAAMLNDCIERLNEKIKKKEKRIGEYMMRKYKDGFSKTDFKQGLSLQEIPKKKQLPAYHTKLPMMQRVRKSQYPTIKMVRTIDLSLQEKQKHSSQLISESRRKVISLYEKKHQIPKKSKQTLSKRKQTLQKLSSYHI